MKNNTITEITMWMFTVGGLGISNYLDISILITLFEAVTWALYGVGTLMLWGLVISLHVSDDAIGNLIDSIEEDPDEYKFGWFKGARMVVFLILNTFIFSFYDYLGILILYILMIIPVVYYTYIAHKLANITIEVNEGVDAMLGEEGE